MMQMNFSVVAKQNWRNEAFIAAKNEHFTCTVPQKGLYEFPVLTHVNYAEAICNTIPNQANQKAFAWLRIMNIKVLVDVSLEVTLKHINNKTTNAMNIHPK